MLSSEFGGVFGTNNRLCKTSMWLKQTKQRASVQEQCAQSKHNQTDTEPKPNSCKQ